MTNPDDIDTDPAPKDPQARLAYDLAELRLAMGEVYAAVDRVGVAVARVTLCQDKVLATAQRLELATYTVEHKQNVQREKLVAGGRLLVEHERARRDHETRLRALEISPDGETAA